jgi:hypothetical protein
MTQRVQMCQTVERSEHDPGTLWVEKESTPVDAEAAVSRQRCTRAVTEQSRPLVRPNGTNLPSLCDCRIAEYGEREGRFRQDPGLGR